jgi:hypothetical protein
MLGSGSAGNSALVATDHCKILINGGLSARQLYCSAAKWGLIFRVLDFGGRVGCAHFGSKQLSNLGFAVARAVASAPV